ncbi:hypothetical protein Taro_008350 [Colocasia esculenta]|uniref:Uncharacterized protein n=1 Tax=Colocasia esculenta TaxID=4460 RepID=A0A843U6Q2_COLES|nr:hypothetical protein [Colocasia esculenta]
MEGDYQYVLRTAPSIGGRSCILRFGVSLANCWSKIHISPLGPLAKFLHQEWELVIPLQLLDYALVVEEVPIRHCNDPLHTGTIIPIPIGKKGVVTVGHVPNTGQ